MHPLLRCLKAQTVGFLLSVVCGTIWAFCLLALVHRFWASKKGLFGNGQKRELHRVNGVEELIVFIKLTFFPCFDICRESSCHKPTTTARTTSLAKSEPPTKTVTVAVCCCLLEVNDWIIGVSKINCGVFSVGRSCRLPPDERQQSVFNVIFYPRRWKLCVCMCVESTVESI